MQQAEYTHSHPHLLLQAQWQQQQQQQQQQMSSLYAQNQVNTHMNSGSQLQAQFQSQTSSYPYHQPRTLEEVKTLWIGDLQYWMEENYVQSCFAHTNEVGRPSICPSLPLSFSFSLVTVANNWA